MMPGNNWELIALDGGRADPLAAPPPLRFGHRFVDQQKPYTGADLVVADIDGDGLADLACGAWWYHSPTWERREIPGIYQVAAAYDLDGDGRQELIATKRAASERANWYFGLSASLCWLKPIDPLSGRWEEYAIGAGPGDWPHGSLVAPVLPGGRPALLTCYHSANWNKPDYPTLFEVPADPRVSPWPQRTAAEIMYGEELAACDLNHDGRLDIIAGLHWLENLGDGSFRPRPLIADKEVLPARLAVADINGDGAADVVIGQELVYWKAKIAPLSPLLWLENPGSNFDRPWKMHIVDYLRCAHSIAAADLDGDGQVEIIAGEHDPFQAPDAGGCRLFIYKKANAAGTAWWRALVDDRFEHHDGAKVIPLAAGRLGIASHGWIEGRYVHLWEPLY